MSRLLVRSIIWRLARLIGRPIGKGSTFGVTAGGLAGASLLGAGWALARNGTGIVRDPLIGPVVVLGGLLGSMVGASIWPAPPKSSKPVLEGPTSEPDVPDPRWSSAAENFDRFKTAKKNAARSIRQPHPPDPESSP